MWRSRGRPARTRAARKCDGGTNGDDDADLRRLPHRVLVHVGGEDLHLQAVQPLRIDGLTHQQGQGVGLLAGGTPDRPDPQRALAIPGVPHQVGNDFFA